MTPLISINILASALIRTQCCSSLIKKLPNYSIYSFSNYFLCAHLFYGHEIPPTLPVEHCDIKQVNCEVNTRSHFFLSQEISWPSGEILKIPGCKNVSNFTGFPSAGGNPVNIMIEWLVDVCTSGRARSVGRALNCRSTDWGFDTPVHSLGPPLTLYGHIYGKLTGFLKLHNFLPINFW